MKACRVTVRGGGGYCFTTSLVRGFMYNDIRKAFKRHLEVYEAIIMNSIDLCEENSRSEWPASHTYSQYANPKLPPGVGISVEFDAGGTHEL